MLAHLPRLLSFGLPLAAAAVLAARWSELPARFPVHWNAGGVVDGHATRTVGWVFGPLLGALALAALFELLASAVARSAKDPRLTPLLRATATLTRWATLPVVALISALAVALPLGQPPSPRVAIGAMLAALIVGLLLGLRELRAAEREVRAAHPDALPRGFHALYYADPDDPRLWVPKTAGVGVTLNFARPVAFVILAALLAPAVLGLGAALLLSPG